MALRRAPAPQLIGLQRLRSAGLAFALQMHDFLATDHRHSNFVAGPWFVGRNRISEPIPVIEALDRVAARRQEGAALDIQMARAMTPIAVDRIGVRRSSENAAH